MYLFALVALGDDPCKYRMLLLSCQTELLQRHRDFFSKHCQNNAEVNAVGLQVHLWVPHTSLTSHAPRLGRGQNVGLKDFFFLHILTSLPPGVSVFQTHV